MKPLLPAIVHLSFELSAECNLAKLHAWCPASIRTGGKLTVPEIIFAIKSAWLAGFRGYVGFHYYNEPLLEFETIRDIVTGSFYRKFMLWTNGTLLKEEHCAYFKWIMVTNYVEDTGRDLTRKVELLRGRFPEVIFTMIGSNPDERMKNSAAEATEGPIQCSRPIIEIPIDCEGNVHLCCQDWKREHEIGNIRERNLGEILLDPEFQNLVIRLARGSNEVPSICRKCLNRVDHRSYRSYAVARSHPLILHSVE